MEKCEVCGKLLDENVTLDEHIAVMHITPGGNCNVCVALADLVGSTSEDITFMITYLISNK